MDGPSFDALTRQLASRLPRRGVFALMTGAASSLLLGGIPPVAAGCKKVGKKCDKNNDCCDHAKCKGGKNGECRCKSGFTECGGKCFDLDKDENHCGSCNTACDPGWGCFDGVCVDLEEDENHCGACGTQCSPDFHCVVARCIDR